MAKRFHLFPNFDRTQKTLNMQIIFKYLTSILLLLFSCSLLAQDFELIKIQSAYYPKQSIEESTVDGEAGFFEWSGQLAIPQTFKKSKKNILIHTLGYTNLRVDTEGSTDIGVVEHTKHYHTISYNLGLIKIFNPKWKLSFNLNPLLASDLEESLNEDDLLLQANALALYSKNKKITYGFGLVYTTRLGRPLVLPMGMFKYAKPKMTIDIILPNKLSVMFNTSNKTFYYGFVAGLNGGLFNNTNEISTINAIVDEAGYSRLNIGPAIAVKLKNNLKVHLKGGMVVGRRMEFIDIDEETFDRTPESGPFFTVGLSFVPKKKSEPNPAGQN